MKSVEIGTGDPAREYTEPEKQRLSENLRRLTKRLHSNAFSARRISLELLRELHAELFCEVRGHAGKTRGPGFGSEYLTFGPHRSAARDQVPRRLQSLVVEAEAGCDRVCRLVAEEGHADEAYRLAASVHAKFINIHPFEDGNGRTGRSLMNLILIRLGYPAVAIEAVRDEYYLVLNAFHVHLDIRPLADFLVRLSTPG